MYEGGYWVDWQGRTQTLLYAVSVTSHLPLSPLVWSVLPLSPKRPAPRTHNTPVQNPLPPTKSSWHFAHTCNATYMLFPGTARTRVHNSALCYCSVVFSHVRLFCGSTDCSPPGSSVHGILQASILEWVAVSSSRDLPSPGIELVSPVSPALTGRFFTAKPPGKPIVSSSIL